MLRHLRTVLWLAVCMSLAGCGTTTGQPEPERFPVQGSVALDGKPLPSGVIYFKTIATGTIDSVDIKDGKFQGKAQPGNRRVEICAYQTVPPQGNGPMDAPTQRNIIPSQYNQESRLTANVSREGPNQFTFDLSSSQ